MFLPILSYPDHQDHYLPLLVLQTFLLESLLWCQQESSSKTMTMQYLLWVSHLSRFHGLAQVSWPCLCDLGYHLHLSCQKPRILPNPAFDALCSSSSDSKNFYLSLPGDASDLKVIGLSAFWWIDCAHNGALLQFLDKESQGITWGLTLKNY